MVKFSIFEASVFSYFLKLFNNFPIFIPSIFLENPYSDLISNLIVPGKISDTANVISFPYITTSSLISFISYSDSLNYFYPPTFNYLIIYKNICQFLLNFYFYYSFITKIDSFWDVILTLEEKIFQLGIQGILLFTYF